MMLVATAPAGDAGLTQQRKAGEILNGLLAAEPQQTLDTVHEFLGLPPHRYDNLLRLHTSEYDPLPRQPRADLAEYFRPHNERLYELLGIDFGWQS